ncbi:MAG: restriction endonuclease subunit S [Pyrinomonadaceae bacterium]
MKTLKSFRQLAIPIDWKIRKFKDVCESILDGTHFSPKSKVGPFKYITSKNIRNDGLLLSNVGFISFEEHEFIYKRCPVKKGDILLTKDGASTGTCCLNSLDEEFSLLSSVAALRVNDEHVNNQFLLQFLKSPLGQKEITDQISGQAITRITLEKIKAFRALVPPLAEQKAIAHVLGLVDKAIELNNKIIAQKELRKKWLMQNLLTGKKRLPGFITEWTEIRLGDLFSRVTRKNSAKCTNVVTISAQRGFVRQTDFFNKSVASETLDNYFLVRRGEYCYNKSYSNGYPWGATKRLNDFDEAVVTTLYICFGIANPERADGNFFEHFFEANSLDRGLTRVAHEGGRAHGLLNVTPSDFFSLKLMAPSYEEQKAIASVLDTAEKEIKLLKEKGSHIREQKKGMMQQLLTGTKRLTVEEQG